MRAEAKKRFKLPFHVVKRLDISKTRYWIIKIVSFIGAFLLAGLVCNILSPKSFVPFCQRMFYGVFNFGNISKGSKAILKDNTLMEFIETAGLLILVAFALAPAFKMKFWNIGAEGQISVGCLVTAGITFFAAKNHVNDLAIIFICLFASIAAGIIWALIPAIFKAFFNTNETLFTLMMNYVATTLIGICIGFWITNGSQSFPYLNNGSISIPAISKTFGLKYLVSIITVIAVVIVMTIYLKKTKQGYELSVVGASTNTARYVGIDVKKVIIRTMIISGAISGLVGFLLVAGHHHTLSKTLADGRGFTGVLIAWLGNFEPGQMILYGFLVAFFQCGSTKAASYVGISKAYFSAIVTGMFFLIVIATGFLVNYKILVDDDTKLKRLLTRIKEWFGSIFAKVQIFFKKLFKRKEKEIEQDETQENSDKEDGK